MELGQTIPKEAPRIPRKPERPYLSSLKSDSMRPRRRPLQTYSKRTQSTESTVEPAPKRQCVTASSEVEQSAAASPSTTPSVSLPPIKKSTITAYFQRIKSQSPVNTTSSEPLSDPSEPTVTPPSSPPGISSGRRIRRLKTRVPTRHIVEIVADDEDGEIEGGKVFTATREGQDAAPPQVATTALSKFGPSSLKKSEIMSKTGSERGKGRGHRRGESRTASIQTTLSLSTNEPQYTECKECDMLYNHLHETDVKYHARRHAALRRVKARVSAKTDLTE
ncbi:hypothetical protein GGS21DRAFT_322848 [Xylaria nigripes]|nr:hypothetical protein GGS21DRAFT_322848 [Xylaria nigripes]